MIKILAFIVLLFIEYNLLTAEILWTDKVIDVSSEYSKREFSAKQALGEPSIFPQGGKSFSAWTSASQNKEKEFIKLGFNKLIHANGILVAENFNPGSIEKIYLLDTTGTPHLVYTGKPAPTDEKARIFRIEIEKTKYLVKAIQIEFNSKAVPGYSSIDAVGIFSNNDVYEPKINLLNSLTFIGEAENLGTNINSNLSENYPIITPDGKRLYFIKNIPTNDARKYKTNIHYSELDNKNNWQKNEDIGKPLNNMYNNFVCSVLPDGTTLLVADAYKESSLMKGGVALAYFNGTTYEEPVPQKILNLNSTGTTNEYQLSNDGQTLLIGVDRADSYGSNDIYVSFKLSENTWSEPLNLGNVINTASTESYPFLSSDNKTLFFASEGMPGYGLSDIYMSRRIDTSWTNWTKPINIGNKVNSKEWEGGLSIPATGDYIYFASINKSIGGEDIFRILIPSELMPKTVVMVKGKVFSSQSKKPIESEIYYQDLATGKNMGLAKSNKKTGEYSIVLPVGKIYGFRADAKGYIGVNENLDLKNTDKYNEIFRNLELVPLQKGQNIKVNNLFFETGLFEIKPESLPELDRIVEVLNLNPKLKVLIIGHTDNVGNKTENQLLSENRALAVKNYIISKGIGEDRIKSKGYGANKPVDSNKTEEGKAKNRRVEMEIEEE